MDMEKRIERMERAMAIFGEMDSATEALALLCTIENAVADALSMDPIELLDTVRPWIEDVANKEE